MYADRVKDTTLSTGTGAITLAGAAPTGYQSFLTAFGTGTQTVAYCIADQTGPNWEVGTGTYNGSANTLARTTVLASSNGGSLVNFTGGTQDVFCTAPAKYLDTFTSANQGVVPASGGGTSNFLRADGTFAAPSTTAPAGSTTQIQYNNAGAFGGSANFTYSTGTNTFTVGPAGATTIIETLAPTGSTVAGILQLRGKNASATNGTGGGVFVTGGTALGTGVGGGFNFTGGGGTSTSTGGGVIVTGGGAGFGGGIIFQSGAGSTQEGGSFVFSAGTGLVAGGGFEMYGGSGTAGAGGNVVIGAGSSLGAIDVGGEINIFAGTGSPHGAVYLDVGGGGNTVWVARSGTTRQLGFFNTTPVAQQASAPVATNLATAITLVNALRTALLNLGLIV
jgi:hypothetical protein